MASKRTWDDVLRDRGFDPEKRKKQQAAKYADESYKSRQETTISQIEQSEAVRKKQALQSIAESDAKKALDTLNLLTMGNADKVLASKRITFNAPYVEPIETVQPPIEQEEKKPWYKITGWDLLKGLFKGQKQKKDMTLEERLAADAEYRKMIGGQPAAYLGSKAEEGLMRFHQGLWNAAATLAENIAPESKVTKDLKKTQAGFENWININQELNQPASEGQKILGDVISSTTQMMPSLIIRTFSPIAGDLAFGIPVVGTSAREAELEGANPAQQLAYGLTSGAAETAIERIAFFKPLEKLMPKGVFSDVVKAGTANMKKSLLGIGWDTLKAMGGEAFEEAIADPISGLAKKVIYDHDKPWLGKNGVVDLKAMAYDALIGGITGGVFSLPTMPFNVSDALAVKKYIDENYDATLILAQGLPEEYASHKKAVEYTKNVYPISYNELVDLQNQVATDLKDYAQKVSKKEAVTSEPVAPAESKQTEPEKPKPAPEPRTIEQKIESLKNARAKLKEGTPGYEAISRQIAELEKEQKKTDVPAAEAAPETVPADKGNVITPETEITAPAAPERQKPSYKVGDTVTLKHGDTTRTITITEIGPATIKGVTDKGTTIQYGKKVFENSTINVVKAQTEPEARTTVQPIPAEKMGNETVMLTNDGTEIKARYAVVSADELITSHNTDMSVNPNYPQELQPRQRERAASIAEVEKMSKNIQPELLGENIKISDGAPIVGDDGIVESGNGRVIALKKMYESGNDAKYREWLEANKNKFGITGELPDKPILVRVRTTDVDRMAFTKMANESSVAAMSATETARSDAEKMSDDLINLFVPNDEGAINTPDNRPFIQRFLNEVVPSNERARLVTKEGMLSQDGFNRIRNALFYKAYGDLDLLDNLTEDLDADLKNVIKAMVANAPKIASIKQGIKEGVLYDLDFSGDIVYAAKKAITLKRTGMKVGEFVNQVSLFEGPTNVQREILAAFEKYNRSAKKINMFIRFISDAVIAAGNPDQIAMFDGITPTKDDIMETALRRMQYELEGVVEGQSTMPVLQSESESRAETARTDATEGAESAEVTAKEVQTEPVANTQSEPQAVSIDTSKYGRSGKAAFEKWSQNKYINADLTKPENEYTQKWMQLFDKYYNLGRENKPMPRFDEKGELEAEFPPFILDEIYRAGKVDYEAQQKHEAKKAWQREEAGEDNKKTEGSFEATMYHGKGKSASEIYTNTQYPVLGEGSYYAFSKKIAANYGKDVTESKVSLKNPYIIRDDVDWKELVVGKVGWKYPNNTFADSEQAIKEIKALKDYLLENGYDGIIVKYEEDREGDINVKTGNPIKTVNKMLGHDQVVVYDVTVETAKTEEKPVETKQEKGGIIEGDTPAAKIAEWVKQKLSSGERFTFADLTEIANEAFGGTQGQGTYSSKDAYDAMELGINKYILENLSDTMKADTEAAKENIQTYREMLGLVPTQTKGNTEQQTHQQFSTPPTIAYVASWIANITKNDTMLEPSAGIGGIAVFAKAAGAKVVVNELSERRLDILKNMPFDEFYNENAEHINDILRDKVRPTVVVMNPPFSATAGRMGNKNSTVNAKAHIEQALEILQDGGRLVAIVGQGMSDKAPAFSDWWKDIKSKYNVRANIGIYKPSEASRIQHTDEYKKYGTDFGVQLLVIDKTGPTKETIATAEPSLEKIIDLLEGVKNDRTAVERDTGTEQVAGSETVQNGAGKGERSDSGRSAAPDTADAVGQRERGTERTGGQEGRTGRQDGARVDNAKSGEKSEVRKPDKRDVVPEGSAETEGQTSETGGTSVERGARASDGNGSIVETAKVETASKEEQINQVNEDMVYSEYKPQKVRIEGAKPHKSPLVQSTAMASVSPPDVYYTPKIPKKLITSGELTEAQMEAIIYAGQQHEKLNSDGTRKAFFIGDGTGVGKGREVAGIILDNWNRGRKKAVWVTKNGKLYNDAIRDWTALGGNEGDIFKAPANKAIERESGILFTTYHTLPQGKKPNAKTGKAADLNRIDQIVNWLGKDYDGVVIFDESHMMQNLLGKNASEMAQAGSDLQDRLPNARFVYASATGATEVENLAYAKRLGAWGEGTSFYDVNDFVGKIKAGGLAAMELVARDLKAMGLYIARNISFIGVKYDTKTHNLTDIQTEIYDKLAEGWQVVLQNMSKYLEKTGQSKNSRAKAFVMQNFWSTQQRFFNQVLTSMQMPTVIEDMKKRLAAGESCVLQLVNTNAAAEEREVSRIEEEGGSLDDMDITPKGALLEMIDKCFPTQKYEEYIDESGKKHSRPVVDSKGNPVEDSSAIAAKKDLMEQIEKCKSQAAPWI